MMDVYTSSLVVLTLLLASAACWKSKGKGAEPSLFDSAEEHRLQIIDDEIHDPDRDISLDRYHNFRLRFLVVYGLAIAGDWLQVGHLSPVSRLPYLRI